LAEDKESATNGKNPRARVQQWYFFRRDIEKASFVVFILRLILMLMSKNYQFRFDFTQVSERASRLSMSSELLATIGGFANRSPRPA